MIQTYLMICIYLNSKNETKDDLNEISCNQLQLQL
jgi:hypothetical protein